MEVPTGYFILMAESSFLLGILSALLYLRFLKPILLKQWGKGFGLYKKKGMSKRRALQLFREVIKADEAIKNLFTYKTHLPYTEKAREFYLHLRNLVHSMYHLGILSPESYESVLKAGRKISLNGVLEII